MNATSLPSDTVVNRIRKLMALTTGRGATEAEAQLASEHVQRLLAEHNLSMSAVEAAGGSSGDGGKRIREGVNRRQVYKWQRTLMAAIAELNYCKSIERFQSRGWSRPDVFDGYDLIGRVDNVATCRVMFEYLLQTIERLARDEVADPSQYFTRYAHSFKEGCADRLVERLEQKRDDMIREQDERARADAVRSKHPGAASSNALVVQLSDVIQDEKDLNEDMQRGVAPGTTARERREYEERQQKRKDEFARKEAELLKAGYGADIAYFMASGYTENQAYDLCKPVAYKASKPETDSQRRRRERSEEHYRDQQRRCQQRESSRLDRGAYRKGAEAGDTVGLDRQVDGAANRGKLR